MSGTRSRAGRRIAIGVVLALIVAAVVHQALPELVAWKLRRELAARGYPDARFRVASIGLDRLELTDVVLAPGLVLGSVSLDAGVSLLWRDATTMSIRGARIASDALPRGAARASAGGAAGPPVRTLHIEDSTLIAGDTVVALAGVVDLAARATQLRATVGPVQLRGTTLRDIAVQVTGDRACGTAQADGIAVQACATLAWSPLPTLRDGRATATSARWSHAGATLERPSFEATFAGDLDAIHVIGELRSDRTVTDELTFLAPRVAIDLRVRELAGSPRIEPAPFVVRAPEVTGTFDGTHVRAEDARLTTAALEGEPVAWTAATVRVGGATLTRAAGEILPDRRLSWRADELRTAEATLRDPSGTVAVDGRVDWRAATLRTADATLASPSGTLAADGRVQWRAATLRTAHATLRRASGTVTAAGRVHWRADELQTAGATGATLARPSGTVAADGRVHWRADEMRLDDITARTLSGTRELDTSVTWRAGSLHWGDVEAKTPSGRISPDGVIALTAPRADWRGHEARDLSLELACEGEHWLLARGTATTHGGSVRLVRPAMLAGTVELEVRGLALGALLRKSGRVDGTGVLDGSIIIRAGALASAQLRARGPGIFQLAERRWLADAAASIADGDVALPERVAGALADFSYSHLALAHARGTSTITLRGRGKRIPQALDLVINVRDLRSKE